MSWRFTPVSETHGLAVELELIGDPTVSRYDSDFITHDLLSADLSWMPRYWRGHARSATPTWELLVEGRAQVLNDALRRRAFDRVAEVWPQAVSLLHLAQAAAELGSELGVIVPMILELAKPDESQLLQQCYRLKVVCAGIAPESRRRAIWRCRD